MLQQLLDAIAQQRKRHAAFASPSSLAAWLAEKPQREEAERELRALLEQLGALVADGVHGGSLAIHATGSRAQEPAPASTPSPSPSPAPPAPPAKPATPAPAPAPPASKQARDTFAQKFAERTVATSGKTEELKLAAAVVEHALNRLGDPPKNRASRKQCNHHFKNAQRVMKELPKWASLEPRIHHLLISALTARLRAIQDDLGKKAQDGSSDVSRAIVAVTRHVKDYRPGVVHGLARDHGPTRPTWWEDARAFDAALRASFGLTSDAPSPPEFNADDELRRLMEFAKKTNTAPTEWIARMLNNGVSPRDKRLINACRGWVKQLKQPEFQELVRAVEEELDTAEDAAVVEDASTWVHIGITRGAKAMIVGGQRRPQRIPPLRDEFQFAQLEWADDPGESSRKVDAIVNKLNNGTVDLVIVNVSLVQHRVTDKLSPTLFPGKVITSDGYGVEAIRQAVERYLTYPGDA